MAAMILRGRAVPNVMLLAAICILTVGLTALWAKITVGKCLPPSNAVRGWKIVPETYKECPSPQGLPDLYNGGWEKYRDAGIIAAATQTYKDEKKLIVIYVQEFDTADHAKAWYKEKVKEGEKKDPKSVKVPKGSGAYYVSGPATVGNVVRGKVHGHIAAMGATEDIQKAVGAFLIDIAKRVGQTYK